MQHFEAEEGKEQLQRMGAATAAKAATPTATQTWLPMDDGGSDDLPTLRLPLFLTQRGKGQQAAVSVVDAMVWHALQQAARQAGEGDDEHRAKLRQNATKRRKKNVF